MAIDIRIPQVQSLPPSGFHITVLMGLVAFCSEITVLLTGTAAVYCDRRHLWAGPSADCYSSTYRQIINNNIIIWR